MTKATLFCEPLSLYHEPPKRKEKYQLFDCPSCDDRMWVSDKKQDLVRIMDNVVLICSICFDKRMEDL